MPSSRSSYLTTDRPKVADIYIGNRLLERKTVGKDMHLRRRFPIDLLPPRLERVVREEFKGRCPTIVEVARIPDSYWLTLPGMGPAYVSKLRLVTGRARTKVGIPSLADMPDGALLAKQRNLIKRRDRLMAEIKACSTELQLRGIRNSRNAIQGSK